MLGEVFNFSEPEFIRGAAGLPTGETKSCHFESQGAAPLKFLSDRETVGPVGKPTYFAKWNTSSSNFFSDSLLGEARTRSPVGTVDITPADHWRVANVRPP